MGLDPQAQLALAAGGTVAALLLAWSLWRRYQIGELNMEHALRTALMFVAILLAATLVFSSRLGALLVAPGAILGLGLWMRRHPTILGERMPDARFAANLAILAGAGGLLLGLVRLATGA